MSISAINLGSSFTNSNGSPVLSGFSSGIDTKSIVDSLVAAQTSQVTKLTDQITVNTSQSGALGSLNDLLTQFKTAANALAAPQSPDSTTNLFSFRTSSVSSNTSQAASNYLSVNVSSSAPVGTYTISDISQLSKAGIQETNGFTLASPDTSVVGASATSGFFKAGSFTLKGQTITLTANQTLNQVAAAFNNVSSDTGITATVVKTATGTTTNTYKLVFTGTNSGLNNAFDLSDSGTVTDTDSVLSNLSFHIDQGAQDAQFKYNGVSVSRSSNTVTDLVGGVTFNLLQDTSSQPAASFSANVTADTPSIANGITNFVNSYNNFLSFYAKQTQIDSTTGQPAKTAVLSSDTTLQSIYTQLTSQAASIVKGLASDAPGTLADLGITFTDIPATTDSPGVSNVLSVDTTILQTALQNNLAGVEKVFGYNATSSSTNLAVYHAPTDQTLQDFTINVDQSGNNYTASYVDKTGATQTINLTKSALGSGTAISLTAPADSGLKGLVLIYGGGGSESGITVHNTNGIASQINNFIAQATDKTSGLITTAQQAISKKSSTTQTQIDNVNDQIAKSRQQLLEKFSALEAAISKANSALNYLNAQQVSSSS